MAKADVWQTIEGKLKSLTSTLQSLPDDMRSMAMEYISKQIAPESNGTVETVKAASQAGTSSEASKIQEQSGNVVRKRGRPPKNRTVSSPTTGGDAVAATATTTVADVTPSSITRTSKRIQDKKGCPSKVCEWLNDDENDNNDDYESPSCMTKATKLAAGKKRGRKIIKSEPEDIEQDCDVEEKMRRRYRKRNCSVATEEGSGDLVIVVKPEIASNNDDDIETNAAATASARQSVGEADNEEEEENAILVAEALTDTQSVLIDELWLPPRKRGRPSKKALKEMEDLGISPSSRQANTANKTKKAIGRPRFSTYASGYVPKEKKFICSVCHKRLASHNSLREHRRRHTGEFYVCDLCGQKFSTNSGFLVHKKYHTDDPDVFKCTICQYTVRSRELLDEHMQLRHDPNRPRDHTCYICGKGFHVAFQLEKHLVCHATSKPYKCDECDFATAYPDGLAKHHYNVHETTDRKTFQCELCNVQLRSKGTYVEHIGRHFNQRNKRCDTCDKTFPTASQLASHRRCHVDPKTPCEVCGKLLRNKHKLKVHMLVHSGQKDFACPYCNYVTYVKHNLKKHCIARHKVDYPPIERPHMKKFCLDSTSELTASLTDPVALKCISKIVERADQHPKDDSDDNNQDSAIECPLRPDQVATAGPVQSDPVSTPAPPASEAVTTTSCNTLLQGFKESDSETVPHSSAMVSTEMNVACALPQQQPPPQQTTVLITTGHEVYTLPLMSTVPTFIAYGLPAGSFTVAGGSGAGTAGGGAALSTIDGKTYVALTSAPVGGATMGHLPLKPQAVVVPASVATDSVRYSSL